GREDQEEVRHAHEARVGQAANEAGHDPDRDADQDGDDCGEEADDHRDPGAVDGQVQHVATQLIRAQDVLQARWLEAGAGRGEDRLEWADEELRGDGHDREEDEDRQAEHPIATSQELGPELAEPADSQGPDAGRSLGRCRRGHVRTRGSRTPYNRSAPRLKTTTAIERMRNTPWRTGKSRTDRAS